MTYCKAAYKGKPALRIKTPCNTHIEKTIVPIKESKTFDRTNSRAFQDEN